MRAIILGVAFVTAALCQPVVYECPKGVPENSACYSGQDGNGAYYAIIIPKDWNGTLVLFAHGGPGFVTPAPLISAPLSSLGASLQFLTEGAAVAASNFRDYGYIVRKSAEDTDNLRRIFIDAFGSPTRTIALGQSYGGIVIAKLLELYGTAPDGSRNYDAALIGCGAVAGYRRIASGWLDFRTVYQYYCRNLPLPEEPQYELWRGLHPDSGPLHEIVDKATQTARERANACTGFLLPAAQRSNEQRSNLANMLTVMRTPESEFPTWVGRCTNLYDIANRLGGRNALSNLGAVYQGSTDDDALNRGVTRYPSDPEARDALTTDAEATGNIGVPVLTLHGIGDDRAIVENESVYRETLENAGTADYLMQTYVKTQGHCVFSKSEIQAVRDVLNAWLDTGRKPVQDDVVAACEKLRAANKDECRFDPQFQPKPWESRVYPRVP